MLAREREVAAFDAAEAQARAAAQVPPPRVTSPPMISPLRPRVDLESPRRVATTAFDLPPTSGSRARVGWNDAVRGSPVIREIPARATSQPSSLRKPAVPSAEEDGSL